MRHLRVLALLLALPCSAQQTYTAAKIVFDHPGPYTQQQLELASGLHAGSQFTADGLGDAAQHLVDTGYFANVGATLAPGRAAAITVLFHIEPLAPAVMVKLGFENFIWLTQAEITSALREKSPLYAGYVQENSPLADGLNDALTAALAQKGVAARVSHDYVDPTLEQPVRALDFRVDSPSVRVGTIHVAGIPAELTGEMQKAATALAGSPYKMGPDGLTTHDRMLAPARNAGYIEATLSNFTATPSSANGDAKVDIAATFVPGEQYHVSALTFAGTPLVSADMFAAAAKLHAGDVASHALLLQSLAVIDDVYRNKGLLDVVVTATPALDSTTHRVAYIVTVDPGDPYAVHEVTTNNFPANAKTFFDREFQMTAGKPYDASYLTNFLKKNSDLFAPRGSAATWKIYADPNTHTVDIVLNFLRVAPQ